MPSYAAISPTYLAANCAPPGSQRLRLANGRCGKKAAELKSIVQAVSDGSMPPGDYTALDYSARLGDDEEQTMLNWASQAAIAAH